MHLCFWLCSLMEYLRDLFRSHYQSRTAIRYLITSNTNIDQCVRFELLKRDRENTKIHYTGLSEVKQKKKKKKKEEEEEEEKSPNKEVKCNQFTQRNN